MMPMMLMRLTRLRRMPRSRQSLTDHHQMCRQPAPILPPDFMLRQFDQAITVLNGL